MGIKKSNNHLNAYQAKQNAMKNAFFKALLNEAASQAAEYTDQAINTLETEIETLLEELTRSLNIKFATIDNDTDALIKKLTKLSKEFENIDKNNASQLKVLKESLESLQSTIIEITGLKHHCKIDDTEYYFSADENENVELSVNGVTNTYSYDDINHTCSILP